MEHHDPRQLHETPHHNSAEEDYKAASKSTVDYNQFMPKLRADHKLIRRIVTTLIAIVVIIGLGILAYKAGPNVGKWFNAKSTPKTSRTAKLTVSIETPNRQYSSSIQNLSFNYPENWKVSENSTEITAKSPPMLLVARTGKDVPGETEYTIRSVNTSLSEFNAGGATAIIPSQTISYTSPATGQRGTTFISFLNYANASGSGIDGVYITGNNGYQSGQNIPASDFTAVDPIVAITFLQCSSDQCSGTPKNLTISVNSWNNAQFSQPLLDMLRSLVIN